ncbi:hypothetical protein RB195_013631 [Necator americanus]|uniref:SCP domain-containing protein n=1 Tax=Necator americanus TaxID=51031 RepID=A0ABR1DXM8_NECAM
MSPSLLVLLLFSLSISIVDAQRQNNGAKTNNQCPENDGMTDAVRQTFLSLHNNFRSSIARGLEDDGAGGKAPKAAKMLKMVYDCKVEASALKHARKCVFRHSDRSERPGLGENLLSTSAIKFDKVEAAKQASQAWWNELKESGVANTRASANEWLRTDMRFGHFSQMAWETSYRLGCAVTHCPEFTMVVCQYGPAGNYVNAPIYTIGDPCKSNAGCPGKYTCKKNLDVVTV